MGGVSLKLPVKGVEATETPADVMAAEVGLQV
jgi:hypothetical protein